MFTKLAPLFDYCTRLANSHPYTWYLGWEAVWRLRFLLPHEQSFHALRHFIALRPKGLFLDIGANNGISALSFRKFSSDYRILSFEPNPVLERHLKKIKDGDRLFDYRIAGAGAIPGEFEFWVPSYKGVVLHTATSTEREQVFAAVARWFSPSIAAKTNVEKFKSSILKLDDLELDPQIIKVDAEGHDYDSLVGLSHTIDRTRPIIVIEMEWADNDKIRSFLSSRNYAQLSYDAAHDRFLKSDRFDPTYGHNSFFVPVELVPKLPGLA